VVNRLLAVLSSILFAVLSGASANAQGTPAPQAEVPEQTLPYLKPQRLVHIQGGRTINLVCLGQGSPTVVLTAGSGGWSVVWNRIQSPLSGRTRVCAWDPAGLGFSSPSPEPQDAVHKTEDLEQALTGAHIDDPYVLVAHSNGAYVALRFADGHRTSMVGMVLVDPSIPDQDAFRKRVAPKFAAFGDGAPGADVERLRQCAAELRSGTVKSGTPEFDRCTASLPLPDAFSSLTVQLARLNADPARLLTQASAIENGVLSGQEVINPHRSYADMPLVVLRSGQHPMPPSMSADVGEQAARYFRTLAAAQDAYAALSNHGRSQLVEDSGHFIQLEKPAVVLAVINGVLAANGPHAANRE
jgi:pimeloyl-ACP methyl ester carboxylesterase